MLIFDNNKHVFPLYQRALSLMISKDFADEKSGKITLVKKQHSEQENSRRELLAVEQEAKQEKIIEQYGKDHFKTQMMSQFFSQVLSKVNNDFDDKESLYTFIRRDEKGNLMSIPYHEMFPEQVKKVSEPRYAR